MYQIQVILFTEKILLPMICNKNLLRQESKEKKFKTTFNQRTFTTNITILFPQLEKKGWPDRQKNKP